MIPENRMTSPDLARRTAALPQWNTSSAVVQRGILAERMRSVRRWVITASFLGTAAFSILAAGHTASTPTSTATATSPASSTTTGVAQSVASNSQASIFSGQTGSSISLSSAGTTSAFGTHIRTASS
ncbi:MAG TPA: hypothetical protein VMU89_14530 [Thermomicrobiaceae bacterium]|nr:hypothetical protein [Thermomicrobiaceae bacterium]